MTRWWAQLPTGRVVCLDGADRAALAADLASGAWDERYGHLRTQPEFHGATRLIVHRGLTTDRLGR